MILAEKSSTFGAMPKGRIAQVVEQLTLNQRVVGSSPLPTTVTVGRSPPVRLAADGHVSRHKTSHRNSTLRTMRTAAQTAKKPPALVPSVTTRRYWWVRSCASIRRVNRRKIVGDALYAVNIKGVFFAFRTTKTLQRLKSKIRRNTDTEIIRRSASPQKAKRRLFRLSWRSRILVEISSWEQTLVAHISGGRSE